MSKDCFEPVAAGTPCAFTPSLVNWRLPTLCVSTPVRQTAVPHLARDVCCASRACLQTYFGNSIDLTMYWNPNMHTTTDSQLVRTWGLKLYRLHAGTVKKPWAAQCECFILIVG